MRKFKRFHSECSKFPPIDLPGKSHWITIEACFSIQAIVDWELIKHALVDWPGKWTAKMTMGVVQGIGPDLSAQLIEQSPGTAPQAV